MMKKNSYLKKNDELNQTYIRVVNEHIYFYSEINVFTALELNAILQDVSMRLSPGIVTTMHEFSQPSPMWLHINSPGGDLLSSLAIADTVERISKVIPIFTIVEGGAASGASIISTAGTKRFIRKNSFMLIHELRGGMWGTHSNMKDDYINNVEFMKTLKLWYKEKTKMNDVELESLLTKDLWLNAKKCLKLGLIDIII